MFHLVKYSIIWKVKNFNIFFWPFIFPIILGTLFYIAFGNVKEADFETIPAVVVEETKDSWVFLEFLEELQKNGTIQVERMEAREAEQALKEQKIEGILYAADTPYLKVNKNGLSQSVLQSILESYLDGKKTIENVMKNSPEKLGTALERMADHQNMVRQVSLGGSTTDGNASYFYALVATACLYGCFIGQGSARWLQANLSPLAARQCASSINRTAMILTELLSSFLLHFLNVAVLLAYLRWVLGLDFQGRLPEMLLVILTGCVMGVSLGILVLSIGKWQEKIKIGIMLGITMTAGFLAGLMFAQMKYIVDQYAPVINRFNPAALIADAFYCINVYDDPSRYARDLITLSVMSAAMLAVSVLVVRRVRYDSI